MPKTLSRAAARTVPSASKGRSSSSRANFLSQPSYSRLAAVSYQGRAHRKQRQLVRSIYAIAIAGSLATASQLYINNGNLVRSVHAEAPAAEDDNPLIFEESRKKKNVSKEENRDMISSQHHQVKRSWENPGVYAWGSNVGRVVAPDSTENVIKTPRRITWFDGKLLRDLKLDRNFGAAIDENGDLLQWGVQYAPGITSPVKTLQGKNLISLTISKDRIIGLSKGGKVYSVPVSADDQENGIKTSEASWIPFWNGRSQISYRVLNPKNLGYSEKITSVASGLELAVMVTSAGRVFSFASASDSFPSRGQLGVPGLTWGTRPEGNFDQPHEIATLRGFNVQSVACGDHHALALDKDGRVFAWGDNASGQLGFDYTGESSILDVPSLVPTQKLYSGTSQIPKVTSIAAGGSNSYFTVDAVKVASQSSDPAANRAIGRITADTFAFGSGIQGNLANNRWTHVQSTPARIPSLSGLFEYDEPTASTVPIRLASLSVGSTHASAVMKNITYLDASSATSTDDTNWGADIVFWGGNEHFQLGTGKRNNVSQPVYIQPLDMQAEVKRAKKSSGGKEEHRFHITPRQTVRLGKDGQGRKISVEQKVECGRYCTAVYSST